MVMVIGGGCHCATSDGGNVIGDSCYNGSDRCMVVILLLLLVMMGDVLVNSDGGSNDCDAVDKKCLNSIFFSLSQTITTN